MSELFSLLNNDDVKAKSSKQVFLKNSGRRMQQASHSSKPSVLGKRPRLSRLLFSEEFALALHDSWMQMTNSKRLDIHTFLKTDLVGGKITVRAAADPHLVGVSGIIVDEARSYLTIWDLTSRKPVKLFKGKSVVHISTSDASFLIDLSNFNDPATRHKRGIRIKGVV